MRIDRHISKIFGAEVAGRGPPRTTRKNCSSGKSQRLTKRGENDAIDFQKTSCQIFSTTGFEQAHERTAAAGKKRKICNCSGRRRPANIGNHKS